MKNGSDGGDGIDRRRWLSYMAAASLSVSGCLGAQSNDGGGGNGNEGGNSDQNGSSDEGREIPDRAQSECSETKKIETDISKDTVLGRECSEFEVVREITVVDGAEVRVLPGATVKFDEDASIKFEDGRLVAEGTEENQIRFSGMGKQRGFWKGLYFSSPGSVNVIRNAVIEHAGSMSILEASEASNVAAVRDTHLDVRNTTIRESAGYGFYLGSDVEVESFDGNTVTQNSLGAGYVQAPSLHGLSATTTYTGNGEDVVDVDVGGAAGLGGVPSGESVTWRSLSADYRFRKGRVNGVAAIRGDLEIEPGTTLRFAENTGMAVKDTGSLEVVGETEEGRIDPITFTGEKEERGYWRGLYFQSSKSEKNQLKNVVLEYGGGEGFSYADEPANLTLTRGSSVEVADSTLRKSAGYGFYFDPRSNIREFSRNTVTGNRRGAGRVNAPVAHQLSGDSTYRGNDRDYVDVLIGRTTEFTGIPSEESVSWDDLGIPYRMVASEEGRIASIRGDLEIKRGADLVFTRDTGITVKKTGSLKAVGGDETSENMVTFTGEEEERGYWLGLNYEGSQSQNNILENAVIEYGGAEFTEEQRFWYIDEPANIVATRRANLTVKNCEILESGGFGVSHHTNVDITLNGNRFARNERGSVYEGK